MQRVRCKGACGTCCAGWERHTAIECENIPAVKGEGGRGGAIQMETRAQQKEEAAWGGCLMACRHLLLQPAHAVCGNEARNAIVELVEEACAL
jgi:hypothetical protein